MILFTPLRMKKITPNDWEEWWKIWNNNAQIITKKHKNHNNQIGVWKGLDLFTRIDIDMIYEAPHAPKVRVIDDLIEQIQTSMPIELFKVRVLENFYEVPFHADHNYPKYEFRCFLWNTYNSPVWSFEYENIKKELTMPEETNTFYYKDFPLKHHSIYDPNYTKGIMAIYGAPKKELTEFVKDSAAYFKDYAWII